MKSNEEALSRAITTTAAPGMISAPVELPVTPAHHLLSGMPTEHLGLMVQQLDAARTKHESLSGLSAVLAGLVCMEAKQRLLRGDYESWRRKYLGKGKTTACKYVAIAKAFMQGSPRWILQQLTLALGDGEAAAEGQTLDLSHPTVATVAEWAEGRSFYQLQQQY